MNWEIFLWLAPAALLGGTVRGFTGFGTAMVYLPVAGSVLDPFAAITTLLAMDLLGPLPGVPRALRDGKPADIGRLAAGLLMGVPLGIAALGVLHPDIFRTIVSIVSLLLLGALVLGLRYRGRLTAPKVIATGGVSGLLAGVSGLAGPPVILFYMASPLPTATIRANVLIYLVLADIAMLSLFGLSGNLALSAVLTGLLLTVPNALGNWLGGRLFDPDRAGLYRSVAYVVIAASALGGLPFWN